MVDLSSQINEALTLEKLFPIRIYLSYVFLVFILILIQIALINISPSIFNMQDEISESSTLPKSFISLHPFTIHHFPNQNHLLGFEKNYPKNIFIPILEYLSEKGLRHLYEACVGTRELYQSKNVVSLALLYKLLSQQWFQRRVETKILLRNICNKFLLNSKIKKKIFHIKVAEVILTTSTENQKIFKKIVSRSANKFANIEVEEDEISKYSNSAIYLLHLFAEALCESNGQRLSNETEKEGPSQIKEMDFEKDSGTSHYQQMSSKQEYKHYIKEIVRAINCNAYSKEQAANLHWNLKETISSCEGIVSAKYDLPDFSPGWNHFIECVVDNCFGLRRDGIKINNSMMNHWVGEFREVSTTEKGLRREDLNIVRKPMLMEEDQKLFSPIILKTILE